MTTKDLFATLILAVLGTASLAATATAQVTGSARIQSTQLTAQGNRAPFLNPQSPAEVRFLKALQLMSPYKQWMIGANKTTGSVDSNSSWNFGSRRYNLKGLENRKFLQYEKQSGMNLGWTDNATAQTAIDRSQWYFSRKFGPGVTDDAILHGQPIAMGWGPGDKPFIKYKKQPIPLFANQPVGIDLEWSSKPSYEWALLGRMPGTKVMRGVDTVILYNLKFKRPMIRFDRAVGGDIGWPGSKRNGATDGIKDPQFFANMDQAARALLMPGVAIGN